MSKYFVFLAMILCFVANVSRAEIAIIGTLQWAGSSATPKNLIYDDNGRRGANGSISGGLIWLDYSYHSNEVEFDPSLGTGSNARLFAQALTQQSGAAIITPKPGFTIDSWDSDWRLPHSGTNPTSNPNDSEMLHLVINELGNSLNSIFSMSSVFNNLMTKSPNALGSGFFAYWLEQDTESYPGTEIRFNTRTGRQETTPDLYHGGYVVFVRGATVSYTAQAPGAASTPPIANQTEGYTVSVGSSSDIDDFRGLYSYSPAAGTSADIVGMGIAGSNDHVYVWYQNGTVSSGSSSNLDQYRAPYQYSLPPGKTPADIVGMGIAGSNDRVYTWYRDGTVSSGSSSHLDQYRTPYQYSLPQGKTPADIVGMGIAGSNDRVYAWYRDGSVSSGSSSDLEQYRGPYLYSLPLGKTPLDIFGMAIAGSDDHVYTWFRPYIR